MRPAALAALIAVGGLTAADPAAADRVRSMASSLCLEVRGASTAPGATVQIGTCQSGSHQDWTFTPAGEVRTPGRAAWPGRVWQLRQPDRAGGGRAWAAATDNVGVVAYDIYRDSVFLTTVNHPTLSTSVNVAAGSRVAFHVTARDQAGNTSTPSNMLNLAVPNCAPPPPPPPPATGTELRNGASGLCLEVRGASLTPGAVAQIGTCQAASHQTWKITAAGELRVLGGQHCLSPRGGATAVSTPVVSDVCTGAATQRWTLQTDGALRAVQAGFCLDVTYDLRVPGSATQLFYCHRRTNQQWLRGDSAVGFDRLPPTAPTGLQIAALTRTSADLSWSPASDNVGVAFYDVYRDGQLIRSVPGGTTSTPLNLTAGARWNLYVNARDSAGNVSQASPTLPLSVPQCVVDSQAPTVPSGLTGTVSGTAVTVNWLASTDNVGVTAYDILRNNVRVGTTSALTYTEAGLSANTPYAYTVIARDAQGNASAPSVALNLTTAASCTAAVCSVRMVADDTQVLWGLVTLSDGTLIYSRRDGRDLVHLNPTTGVKRSLGVIPDAVLTGGEGGMLGLAATAAFPATDPWLYLYSGLTACSTPPSATPRAPNWRRSSRAWPARSCA